MKRNRKPHFQVTAGLVWENGKVLIAKRPQGSHLGGLWEFPGGKQEEGETLEACLEREIEEELDLKVKAAQRLLTVEHEYESRSISLHVFSCTSLGGQPRAVQNQEFRWVDPSELEKLRFPPADLEIIKFLVSCAKEDS